ncbi:peptidyl-prolyl cis-trans isomerase [Pseudothermotoga thermarum]|uniref:peptidylprolyl isomerase n=1 Tax=Pseudothermotoga thermarum DSM 5069 TaxID=688269 RepID=F7YVZ8_9THEM|nr:peptidyl-prolyl cis-trans isomerase [Pseudothermotoga thermarum]AEH50485.1 hypothetical protein Theth_0390 [Pseudothermotoga thermarum DSM 5069]
MRRWIKKWQKVIVWGLAIAFIAGIAFWSVGTYIAGRAKANQENLSEEVVGYLEVKGQQVKDKDLQVTYRQLEQEYQNLLMFYGWQNFDPLFDEPAQKALLLENILKENVVIYYAKQEKLFPSNKEISSKLAEYKKQIESNESLLKYVKTYYGSVDNYLDKVIKPDVLRTMAVEKVRDKVAKVSEEDMKKYFEENMNQIKRKYDKVDASYVNFEDKTAAEKFLAEAQNVGFDQAATNLNLQPQIFSGLTRGLFEEEYENQIFSAKEGEIVGPIPFASTFYVFKINKSFVINNFDSFKNSDGYLSEMNSLQSERFQNWYDSYVSENEIKLVIKDEVYNVWSKINKVSRFEDLVEIYQSLVKKLFAEDGSLLPDVPDTMKSAFLALLDKVRTFANDDEINSLGPIKDQEKKVVEYLYNFYPSLLRVAQAMYRVNPDNVDAKYNYFSLLYSQIKPYLLPDYVPYILQTILELEVGLESIARNEDAPKEYRTTAFYNLYDLTKSIGDKTSAKFYLNELRKLDPNYIDFDSALQELESGQ